MICRDTVKNAIFLFSDDFWRQTKEAQAKHFICITLNPSICNYRNFEKLSVPCPCDSISDNIYATKSDFRAFNLLFIYKSTTV